MPRDYSHTQGIIIKRINYKDADRILTIYTKELGKVTVRAIGIRKIKSKKKSHLELLNLSNLYLVKGRHWYIVTQADLIESFSNLKGELQTTQWGYFIAEIFEKLIPENEPDDNLFSFLHKTLLTLNGNKTFHIVNAFHLKLLKMLGYYSKSITIPLPPDMKEYLDLLENKTYDEIIKMENTKIQLVKNTHSFLREKTEEILERPIKTKVEIT